MAGYRRTIRPEPGTLEAVADLATQWFARYLEAKDARPAPTNDLSAKPDRTTNRELPNKREMIQTVIDEEQEPWIIMKPSRQDPTDPEPLCIFENPTAQTQAKTEIPVAWFQNRQLQKIKTAFSRASGTRKSNIICNEPASLQKVRRVGNDIQALFGLELRIGTLVKLDHGRIHLADNKDRGSRRLPQSFPCKVGAATPRYHCGNFVGSLCRRY